MPSKSALYTSYSIVCHSALVPVSPEHLSAALSSSCKPVLLGVLLTLICAVVSCQRGRFMLPYLPTWSPQSRSTYGASCSPLLHLPAARCTMGTFCCARNSTWPCP